MLSLKVGIEDLKQAKTLMSEANHIMSDHISKLKALEEENAELRDELDDWKGNAEGFQPDSYMKLPVDADGEPIRIGDEMDIDGDAMTVLGYRLHDDMLLLVTEDKKRGLVYASEPLDVRHFKQEPADSWEKLEQDVPLSIDDYWTDVLGRKYTFCTGDKVTAKSSDIIRRAKKLAGIEELEGGER